MTLLKTPPSPDFGNYQKKSNGVLLQIHDLKSIFSVTITMIDFVIEYPSNYCPRIVIMSKYFPGLKNVTDYSSKYIESKGKF